MEDQESQLRLFRDHTQQIFNTWTSWAKTTVLVVCIVASYEKEAIISMMKQSKNQFCCPKILYQSAFRVLCILFIVWVIIRFIRSNQANYVAGNCSYQTKYWLHLRLEWWIVSDWDIFIFMYSRVIFILILITTWCIKWCLCIYFCTNTVQTEIVHNDYFSPQYNSISSDHQRKSII